jgi:hypothetical protein
MLTVGVSSWLREGNGIDETAHRGVGNFIRVDSSHLDDAIE